MKRQTLETAIAEILAPVLAHDPAATLSAACLVAALGAAVYALCYFLTL